MTRHTTIATPVSLLTGWAVRDVKSRTMTERENPKLKEK